MTPTKSSTKWIRTLLAMQTLVLLIVLFGSGTTIPAAKADGIPDAGAQRDEIIQQIKATNEKLDKLSALLSSGNIQVKIQKADESDGHP